MEMVAKIEGKRQEEDMGAARAGVGDAGGGGGIVAEALERAKRECADRGVGGGAPPMQVCGRAREREREYSV